jgi:hypothetical protein
VGFEERYVWASRLTFGGAGLRTLSKRNMAAGTYRLAVALTAAGRSAARAYRSIEVHVGLVVGK